MDNATIEDTADAVHQRCYRRMIDWNAANPGNLMTMSWSQQIERGGFVPERFAAAVRSQPAAGGARPPAPPAKATAAPAPEPNRDGMTDRKYADGTPFGSGSGTDRFAAGIKLPRAAASNPVAAFAAATVTLTAGMISEAEAGRRLDMGPGMFRQYVRSGAAPQPDATVKGQRYWKPTVIDELARRRR